jgi:hypothetical protein
MCATIVEPSNSCLEFKFFLKFLPQILAWRGNTRQLSNTQENSPDTVQLRSFVAKSPILGRDTLECVQDFRLAGTVDGDRLRCQQQGKISWVCNGSRSSSSRSRSRISRSRGGSSRNDVT